MKTPSPRLIPLFLVLACASSARAGFNPITLNSSSFNTDIVVESNAAPSLRVVTTASVDNGIGNTANTWMEQGFDPNNPGNGLPPAGTVITAVSNANYQFIMPPDYTAPNGILIDTVISNGTFTLVAPAPYAVLSFLSSGGNGGDVISVTVHHLDGTTESSSFGSPDWFNGTSNVAFVANERCGSTTQMTYANVNSGNPRLYFRDMTLANTTSPVTSVDFAYLSGQASSHNDIVAMSGATTLGGPVSPIIVTGYDYDFVVEATAPKRGRVFATDGVTEATTATMDQGPVNNGFTWYEIGHNFNDCNNAGPVSSTNVAAQQIAQSTGLPPAGSMVTNAAGDRVYVLPPDYTANNALMLTAAGTTSGTLTFSTPTAASALSFLAAGGNGGATEQVVVHHADSTTETNYITVPDWFNDGVPFVFAANGRVAADTAQWSQITNANRNPRIFNCDALFLGDPSSPITSVDVNHTNTSSATVAILAVSGNPGPLAPIFLTSPQSVTTNAGGTVQFNASATADVAVTYQWQRGTGGVFNNLSDGGNISGSTTETLTVSSVGDADEGNYRLVATDSAGSANSTVATLIVLSPLNAVTVPGDTIVGIPNNGNEPNEGVEKAIDNNTQKYLNFSLNSGTTTPVGFVVTPSMGRTRVTALQLIAANDAPERDPANSILEGSDDGGVTWTLITSNAVAMPDARNAAGQTVDANLFTLSMVQLKFANANGYSQYRWTVTQLKNKPAANSMQIGEVRLLGVADTSGKPVITGLPDQIKAYDGTSASFSATITGTPAPTIHWQKNTGSGFVNLTDGGNISGSGTASLTINPAHFSDAANYRVVASNTSGSTTSSIVALVILSSLPDVTQPGDTITDFGNASGNPTDPTTAIDNLTDAYNNPGSGLNVQAGFPPFGGPVGLVITPGAGLTRVNGVRLYTSAGNPERDPADFTLEGSNNGGTSYTLVASGALSLPLDRNAAGQAIDPLTEAVQEVLFGNISGYTSYRITFNHVRDDNNANSLQFGDLELLGTPVAALTFTFSGGTLSITSSLNGTLQSTTSLSPPTTWTDEGPITAGTPVNIAVDQTILAKFYRVRTQ